MDVCRSNRCTSANLHALGQAQPGSIHPAGYLVEGCADIGFEPRAQHRRRHLVEPGKERPLEPGPKDIIDNPLAKWSDVSFCATIVGRQVDLKPGRLLSIDSFEILGKRLAL